MLAIVMREVREGRLRVIREEDRVQRAKTISPSSTVHKVGLYIDSDLSIQSQVQRTVAGCFAALRQID